MAKPSTAQDSPGSSSNDETERKYRAPALEKGLDVLELLAREGVPLTTSQIASQLGRSVSELFRMVLTLEYRGYIAQSENGEGYELTNHLFTLGMAQAPTRTLLDVALPIMKELAQDVGQSCHLVVASGDQVVVVARIESPRDLGFAVRLGYRRRVIEAASGLLLYGLRSEQERAAWRPALEASDEQGQRMPSFLAEAEQAAAQGYMCRASDFVDGVTDLACPVMGREGPVAALTVPFIQCNPLPCTQEEVLERLKNATSRISSQLGGV
ncbi:DNA-binding IclR family transcriptional regulator [Marinimicrobium koreense]|uniref:DNA-binding IclR family transcriptional regulator n=1 Tax=Marinimicrobium koreense TaxID=306545 RepID=A0A3N1NXN9_9GAMM|nr:IclR family transcriptional regulator [Marinimicrobium koreense]ROQ19767.1 DNA-binding IclR family transcriptional regulator [Marinimicrobium koreense]